MSYVDIVTAQLKKYEGLRKFPYIDTVGATSIGYGRNLRDNGISEQEADFLLANDIDRAIPDSEQLFSAFEELSDNRKAVIVNIMYNIGYSSFSNFKIFRQAVANERWDDAADALVDSLWYTQVKQRGIDLVALWRKG